MHLTLNLELASDPKIKLSKNTLDSKLPKMKKVEQIPKNNLHSKNTVIQKKQIKRQRKTSFNTKGNSKY